MISLSARLSAAADLIGGGAVADIGTDHAFLPVYLIQSGRARRVIACDIGEKPLENAKKTLEQYGLGEPQITLRISDGLSAVSPEEADTISICGMGGTLIARILADAPWICRERMHLVLQPNSHAEDVRAFLFGGGFILEKEFCVTDARRLYCCMSARFAGAPPDDDPGRIWFGTLLSGGEAERYYAERVFRHIKTRADAIRAVSRNPGEEAVLRRAIEYYERCVNR